MKTREQYKEVLRSHSLRITECRLDVIDFFHQQAKALSQNDLEQRFPDYDPVTLYRTLNSFFDASILHKIPSSSGAATYGLYPETNSPETYAHNHIHFKCTSCGQVECLVESAVPAVSVPPGYKIEMVNLVVDGVCAHCS